MVRPGGSLRRRSRAGAAAAGIAHNGRVTVKRAVLLLWLVLAAGKLLAAARVELFGDELFYWECGQRPALAYIDHPPLTALSVRLGSELLGDTSLGARLVLLLVGLAIPGVVLLAARPLVGERDAWLAAGLAMILPAVGHAGLVSIPDVPLLLFTGLLLLTLQRALARPPGRDAAGWWLGAGLAAALGLATHYRFSLVVAAVAAAVVLTSTGRRHLRTVGPWLAVAAAVPGLLPALAINVRTGWAPVRYYLAGRHAATVDWTAPLEFLGEQIAIVTPLLFVVVIATLVAVVRRVRRGADLLAPFAAVAAAHIGLYLLASPFESSGLATEHWPAPGYLALLPFVPGVLRGFVERRPSVLRRAAAIAAPALAGGIMAVAVLSLATGWPSVPALERSFQPWSPVTAAVSRVAAALPRASTGRPLLVADNYRVGAVLERAFGTAAEVYVLDHPRNRKHGRGPQYRLWGMGEDALAARAGEPVLLVVEFTATTHGPERDAWFAHLGSLFTALRQVDEVRVPRPGARVNPTTDFRLYEGTVAPRPDGGGPVTGRVPWSGGG